jgi:glutamate/tyrosine decarboxylase-like PLP-dependent enzyme
VSSFHDAANLMGLAMARERKTPANENGLYNRRAGVIYASDQVHMAVPKAVAFLGIGRDNLHYVPCDDSYRMVPSLNGACDPAGRGARPGADCSGRIGGNS